MAQSLCLDRFNMTLPSFPNGVRSKHVRMGINRVAKCHRLSGIVFNLLAGSHAQDLLKIEAQESLNSNVCACMHAYPEADGSAHPKYSYTVRWQHFFPAFGSLIRINIRAKRLYYVVYLV